MKTPNYRLLWGGLILLVLAGWMVPGINPYTGAGQMDIRSVETAGVFSDLSLLKEDLFQKTEEGYILRFRDESGKQVRFPRILNAQTPVVFTDKGVSVPEYVPVTENLEAERVGSYLIYSGSEGSLFYWYDEQNHELQKFVRPTS